MFLKGYGFLGRHIVLHGFAVFGTILNFHRAEASKILSGFARAHTPGNAGLLVIKCLWQFWLIQSDGKKSNLRLG